VSGNEMTTEGRKEVEAAVYKGRTTTRDVRIRMHDESGQDIQHTPILSGRKKGREKK